MYPNEINIYSCKGIKKKKDVYYNVIRNSEKQKQNTKQRDSGLCLAQETIFYIL